MLTGPPRSGVGFEEAADEAGGVLAELAVIGAERGEKMAIDVELSDNLSIYKNGHDDFGLGFEGTCEVARVAVNVIDHDGFAGRGRGPTDALIEGNASVRSECTDERAEDEDVASRLILEHVETDPVIACEFFMEEGADFLHEVAGAWTLRSEGIEFRNQVRALENGRSHIPH